LILFVVSPKLELSRVWCGFVFMAEKTQKKRIINLLPNRDDTLLNQFLSWSLSVGRLLVIITETLALSVFLYRFSLDMKIVDLHDKIKTERIIVNNFKDGEVIYRNLQSTLATARQYESDDDHVVTVVKDVIGLGKNKITFINVTATQDAVDIQAQAQSAGLLSLFTQALKSYPEVTGITINRVESKTSSSVVIVSITAQLRHTEKAPTAKTASAQLP